MQTRQGTWDLGSGITSDLWPGRRYRTLSNCTLACVRCDSSPFLICPRGVNGVLKSNDMRNLKDWCLQKKWVAFKTEITRSKWALYFISRLFLIYRGRLLNFDSDLIISDTNSFRPLFETNEFKIKTIKELFMVELLYQLIYINLLKHEDFLVFVTTI